MKQFILAMVCLLCLPASAFALTPTDPLFDEQWYLTQIAAPLAWDAETGNTTVIVAVLDSGVDLNHADLLQNIWVNPGETPENNRDDDKNGYVDDVNGWDFVERDNDPSPTFGDEIDEEAAAHGSLVAGLIGAVGNNGEGVSGVAWSVRIMPLRALNDVGTGSSLEVSEAIYYAIENGADVINLSFSGEDSDQLLRNAVRDAYEAGIVVVAALGNENMDTDLSSVFPSCYKSSTDDWVIGVAATNHDDEKANFSNYGDTCADLAAPGVDIFGVSVHEPTQGFVAPYEGGWIGTSMSSPLVSGASAILLSAFPQLSPSQVRVALQLGVDPVLGAFQGRLGTGRLNVARALQAAAAMVEGEVPTPQPIVVPSGLVPGDFFKAPSFPDVYVLTENGGRRVVVSANTYFTYAESFQTIKTVKDSDIAGLRLEGLVLPNAGVVLVKIPSVETVYAIEQSEDDPYEATLRAISNEEVASAIYGDLWADYVIDVDPSFFTHFHMGEDIVSPIPVDTSIMKTRSQLSALATNVWN